MKKSKLMIGILTNRHNKKWDEVAQGLYQAQKDLEYLNSLPPGDNYMRTIATPQGFKDVPVESGRAKEITRIMSHIQVANAWLARNPRKDTKWG